MAIPKFDPEFVDGQREETWVSSQLKDMCLFSFDPEFNVFNNNKNFTKIK